MRSKSHPNQRTSGAQFAAVRFFDLVFSGLGLLVLAPLGIILLFASLLFQPGPPLYFQSRVGWKEKIFIMIKFRTMKPETISQATHLVCTDAITPWGNLLRLAKIDEIPQLWNVLLGEMSLVGPRPCLPNQDDLIRERRHRGVFMARPGITGLAQILGVDMSTPTKLAETDARMIHGFCLHSYFVILLFTIFGLVPLAPRYKRSFLTQKFPPQTMFGSGKGFPGKNTKKRQNKNVH